MRESFRTVIHFMSLSVLVYADQVKTCHHKVNSCQLHSPFFTDASDCTALWGEWSRCSVTCGKGLRTRTRRCVCDVSSNRPFTYEERVEEICIRRPCTDGTREAEFQETYNEGEDDFPNTDEQSQNRADDGDEKTNADESFSGKAPRESYLTDDADSDGFRRENQEWDSDNADNGQKDESGEHRQRKRMLESDRERTASIDSAPEDEDNKNQNTDNDDAKYDEDDQNNHEDDDNLETDGSADNTRKSKGKKRGDEEQDEEDNEEEDRDEENSEEEKRKRRKRRRKRRRRRRRRHKDNESSTSTSSSSDSSSSDTSSSIESDSDNRIGLSVLKDKQHGCVSDDINLNDSYSNGEKPSSDSSSELETRNNTTNGIPSDGIHTVRLYISSNSE